MDPYETLGVSRDANEQEIKNAYRRAAKANHPDAGGDAQKMASASRAYALLSDPDARAHFDRTGEDSKPDANGAIVSRFCELVEKILVANDNLDVKKAAMDVRRQFDAFCLKKTEALAAKEKKLKKALERVITAPENNLIAALMNQGLRDIDKERSAMEAQKIVEYGALDMFEAYTFAPPVQSHGMTFYTAGGSSAASASADMLRHAGL